MLTRRGFNNTSTYTPDPFVNDNTSIVLSGAGRNVTGDAYRNRKRAELEKELEKMKGKKGGGRTKFTGRRSRIPVDQGYYVDLPERGRNKLAVVRPNIEDFFKETKGAVFLMT